MEVAFETVRLHREEQQQKLEYYYNKDTRFSPYVCGDLVWIDDPTTQRLKLSLHWSGPYKVVSVDEKGLVYKLVDVKYTQAVTKVIHYDRLKPYRNSTEAVPLDVTQTV